MPDPIKVLIVDDSSLVRQALRSGLSAEPGIEVVGVAPDPYVARDMIERLSPDVLTLDIEMPRLDGISFLRKLQKFHPIPTIIVSSLAKSGSDTAMAALDAGAFDVVCKPGESFTIGDVTHQIAGLVRAAAAHGPGSAIRRPEGTQIDVPARPLFETTKKVIALGCSTGGTQALAQVLPALPSDSPGVMIVQHMPPGFTASFAERLNSLSKIEVREAKDGDAVMPGLALLAPGDQHMRLCRDGARYLVSVGAGPRVLRHRPSVEVLFESTAQNAGRNAMGVIMTGMGNDGAGGLLSMRTAGAYTVAQDEASSVVYGMPREAALLNAAVDILPLDDIAGRIVDFAAGDVSLPAAG